MEKINENDIAKYAAGYNAALEFINNQLTRLNTGQPILHLDNETGHLVKIK